MGNSAGRPTLHIHHDPLLLQSLRVGCDATHFRDSLLLELPLPRLHLFDKNLGLQVVWLDLADVLLMRRVLLAWNVRVLLFRRSLVVVVLIAVTGGGRL